MNIVFVCLIVVSSITGNKVILPTGEAWKSVEDCLAEASQYAQESDVSISCVAVNKN